eukprot:TRINITY_DN7338_c0_g1_i2.p1 TRINITY_DN7338_c0_g1~~TRINITY_DN7338_c0_g1_i2.p1  ORF type:complete len:718 (+),score=277.01 TRINITY_DN7338_c0_g1_i2:204-2156(+)
MLLQTNNTDTKSYTLKFSCVDTSGGVWEASQAVEVSGTYRVFLFVGQQTVGSPTGTFIPFEGESPKGKYWWVLVPIAVVVLLVLAGAIYGYQRYRSASDAGERLPLLGGSRGHRGQQSTVDMLTVSQILDNEEIPKIPWRELTIESKVGVGAGGIVYKGQWNGREVAVKELHCAQWTMANMSEVADEVPEAVSRFLMEIKISSEMKHPHIVEFLGVTSPDGKQICLVSEYMHHSSIDRILTDRAQDAIVLSANDRISMALGAARGIEFLHQSRFIHRDIKPGNLLVNKDLVCKVSDFGISTILPEQTQTMTVAGTPAYMAPEVLVESKYSQKADVYSFAITMWQMYTKILPFSDQRSIISPYILSNRIMNGLRPSLENVPPALANILRRSWAHDPIERPSFSSIIMDLETVLEEEVPEYEAGSQASAMPGQPGERGGRSRRTAPVEGRGPGVGAVNSHSSDAEVLSSSAPSDGVQRVALTISYHEDEDEKERRKRELESLRMEDERRKREEKEAEVAAEAAAIEREASERARVEEVKKETELMKENEMMDYASSSEEVVAAEDSQEEEGDERDQEQEDDEEDGDAQEEQEQQEQEEEEAEEEEEEEEQEDKPEEVGQREEEGQQQEEEEEQESGEGVVAVDSTREDPVDQ